MARPDAEERSLVGSKLLDIIKASFMGASISRNQREEEMRDGFKETIKDIVATHWPELLTYALSLAALAVSIIVLTRR